MKKIVVSSIDWFAPGAPDGMLPEQIVIEDQTLLPVLLEDIDSEAANLAEYLTQKYGCLVNGFVAEVEEVEP